MKNLLSCLFVLLVLGIVAVKAQGTKISVVKPLYAMEESTEGKTEIAQVNSVLKSKQTQLNSKAKEIQDLQKKIREGANRLGSGTLRRMQNDLQVKKTELKRFQEDTQREINRKRDAIFKKLGGKISPLIRQIALEKGLDLVVRSNSEILVYVNPRVDITNELIRKMNGM